MANFLTEITFFLAIQNSNLSLTNTREGGKWSTQDTLGLSCTVNVHPTKSRRSHMAIGMSCPAATKADLTNIICWRGVASSLTAELQRSICRVRDPMCS
jgi:hypothetical protein